MKYEGVEGEKRKRENFFVVVGGNEF